MAKQPEQYHIIQGDRNLCTFYDRRILAEMLWRMFPLGAADDLALEFGYADGTHIATYFLNEVISWGREKLMRL